MSDNTEVLTLNHPKVQEVKAKWEEAQKRGVHSRKHTLSFEDWFAYFQAHCIRMSALGEHAGLSRQRVHQIYNQYFRDLFGDMSGRRRLQACTLEARLVRTKRREIQVMSDEAVSTVIAKIREAGIEASLIVETSKSWHSDNVLTKELLVNGERVPLVTANRPCKMNITYRVYGKCYTYRAHLQNALTVIFYCHVPNYDRHIFIVPSKIVLAAYFEGVEDAREKALYLPVEKRPIYKNNVQRIDWWSYEDAWHLLAPKHEESPVSE